MWSDRESNPGSLAFESDALPTILVKVIRNTDRLDDHVLFGVIFLGYIER